MVRSEIISALKANRLYWLGRYENRVYLTLHQLNKCHDRMIDGEPAEYEALWKRLDISGAYATNEAFTLGLLYDEANPCSLLSAQRSAMDNAMLLREDIMSETLSYLEMSMALMKKCKAEGNANPTCLQAVTDWTMAFWGSAEQRLQNHRALNLMMLGRNVENIDMLLRFGYPHRRIALAYESLRRYCTEADEDVIDPNILCQLDALLAEEAFDGGNDTYTFKVISLVNQLVRV